MSQSSTGVVALFAASGLAAGALGILLGWLCTPFLFFGLGLLLLCAIAGAHTAARFLGWLPGAPARWRYAAAGALLAFGYTACIYAGSLLALLCEGMMMLLPHSLYTALRAREPLPMIALVLFWGAPAAAIVVNFALVVVSENWDIRIFRALLLCGLGIAFASIAVYAPFYDSSDPMIAAHRELILFGVMLLVGFPIFSGLTGYGLARARPAQPRATAATASN